MKKIMGFLKKPSKQSQESEQDSAPYHLVSNNNDDSLISLSSVHQEQQQPSQEEIRRQRLAQLDKQPKPVPERQRGISRDITNHPLTIEFGQNAYFVHMFLEDLYQNTFHPNSLNRNPQLKLLQPAYPIEVIKLYTQENMDQDIMKFLQSQTYYPSHIDKLTYLHDIYGRITSKSQEDLISEEKVLSLQKTILKSLFDYLSISISITQEDPRVLTDFKNPLYDTLYTKLSAVNTNGFFYHFIRNLPDENYDSILTPIFKRIIRNTAENSVKKRHDTLISITLLQDLIHCNTKIADFLFQHELHLPQNATGQDYQKNTVFGVFLSLTIMDNNSSALWSHLDLTINEFVHLSQKLRMVSSFSAALNIANPSFSKPLAASRLFAKTMIQIFDPYLMEQLHRLHNFQILLMLNAYGQKISGLQDLSSSGSTLLFEQLQAPTSDKRPPIPKFLSLNIHNYLIHFTNVNKEMLQKKFSDLNLIMNFMLSLNLNKFDTSLPDLRTLSLRWIARLSENINWGWDEQFESILKTSPFYEKNLPQALVVSFLDSQEIYVIQNLPSLSDPGRVEALAACNSLLEKVFTFTGNSNSYLMEYLKDLFHNQERYLQFMNIFMDDIISLLDDLCEKFAHQNPLPQILTKEQQTSFEVIINALRHYYRFAVNLSKHCPEFFLDDIVRDQFAVCLNYSIKVLNREGFMGLLQKIEVFEATPNPGLFVASLVGAYVNLAHNNDFMQSVVNDKENCEVGYFYQTQYSSEENQRLSDNDKQKFSELIATLDLLTQSNS